MSVNTRLRFLEPVDPRAVFKAVAELVHTPHGAFNHQPAGSEPTHDFWPINPRIRTNGGSDASVTVEYGSEASLLVEEWDVYPEYADDYPPNLRGPHAYVLLDIESSGGHLYDMHHAWRDAVLQWSPVPVAVENFSSGEWVIPA